MANLSNINNKLIVTDGGNLLVNATANLTTYGGLTIDNISNPSIAMKTNSASGWIYNQYITNTGTNNFSMGVNQTIPYWGVKAGAGMDNPALAIISSGNVGIGTISPDNILHIETSNAGGPQIQLESTSGTASAAFINFDSTSLQLSTQRDMVDGDWYDTSKSWGGINIQGPAGGSFITFHTAAASNTSPTQRMRIDSGGSFIFGDGATSGTPAGDYRSLEIGRQGNTITGAPWKSNLYFSTNATITAGSTTFTYRYASVPASNLIIENGEFSFQNAGSGSVGSAISFTERMRIHEGGSITMGEFNSTNAPNNGILKIKTGGSTAGTCYPLLSIMGSTHLATRQYGIGMDPEGYSNRVKMFFGVDGNGNGYSFGDFVWNINTVANNDAVTPSDEKMRLNKLGYLGLGGSAAVKLEVFNGSLRVRGSLANTIELSNTSGNTRATLGQAGNEGDLSLYRSNNSKYVYLSSYYNCYINPQQSSAVVGIGGVGTGIVSSGPGGDTTLDVQGPLRNKRVMRGWYHCGPITSSNAYRHIKTNLWMGDGPRGNDEYIMGGFEAKGYAYYGSYPGFGHGTCVFHNWSGGFASLQVANYGTAGFMQSPYKSTDGYCVIVLRHNTYMQPAIDFSQYYTPYPWRTSYVTAETTSANLTGVY